MIKKLLAVILVFVMLSTVSVYAVATGKTTTLIWFNIGILEAVKVQMLSSGTWTEVTAAGAATTNDIDINSTGNEATWQNASIRGTATTQGAITPIIQIQNQGSVNASINISLNSTITGAGSCLIRFRNYNSTTNTMVYPPIAPDLANSSYSGNVTLINPLTTSGTGQTMYLWLFANYSLCASTDSTSRNFTIYADYVA